MKKTGKILLMILVFFEIFSCSKKEPGGSAASIIPTGITLEIRNPNPVNPINGIVPLYATIKGGNVILKVEFYIDGVLKGSDPTGFDMGDFGHLYGIKFDFTPISSGKHTLMVKAIDINSKVETQSMEINVNKTSTFSINYTTPASDGISYDPASQPSLTISGTFSGVGNKVVSAELDGLPIGAIDPTSGSFSVTWNYDLYPNVGQDPIKVIPGDHIFSVTVMEDGNPSNTYTLARTINVQDKVKPTVNLYGPGLGAVVETGFYLSASVADVGGISSVEFFLMKKGTSTWTSVGTATQSPYQILMNLTDDSLNGEYYVKIVAKDTSNNTETYDSSLLAGTNTIKIAYPKKINVISSEEGYISAQDGGANAAIGTDGTRLMIGHQSSSYYGKGLFSFDTSSIPDGAVITKAYLTLTMSSVVGEPWSLNSLVVDIKNGNFGASSTIETGDWLDTSTYDAVASINPFTSGNAYSSDFNGDGLSSINKTGKTQLRVSFAMNPATAGNYIWLQRNKAVLTVLYY